jgi:tagatose-6-phosphate ketose/aldose isomerase
VARKPVNPLHKGNSEVRKEIKVPYPNNSLLATEIAQQPTLWPTTLERVAAQNLSRQPDNLPVILTGAGTSAYAALAVADAWPGARAIPTTDLLLQSAAEVSTAVPSFPDGGWLISLARSGESPESVGVVEKFKRLFPAVKHLAIVCNAEGRLANTSGVEAICLDPRTNDQSLAMTSSFSNLVLGGLCFRHQKRIAEELPAICDRVSGLLPQLNAAAAEIAGACKDRIIFLTSGMHALALEAALKVVELTGGRVLPLPETFLGLRHGPLSFSRSDTPIICFLSTERSKRRYEREVLEDLRAGGAGRLALIGDEDASGWEHDCIVDACAPGLPDCLRTPFEVPFAQLLAYHLSIHSGINPENPSPGGVITRVVKAFRIHEDLRDS